MIYYVNDVMNEDENNELAIATLELSAILMVFVLNMDGYQVMIVHKTHGV